MLWRRNKQGLPRRATLVCEEALMGISYRRHLPLATPSRASSSRLSNDAGTRLSMEMTPAKGRESEWGTEFYQVDPVGRNARGGGHRGRHWHPEARSSVRTYLGRYPIQDMHCTLTQGAVRPDLPPLQSCEEYTNEP